MHPLRKARLGLGYTQRVLADFAQVSESTIKRAEANKQLRADNIYLICSYFSERYNRQVEPRELGLVPIEAEEEPEDNEPDVELGESRADKREDMNRRGALKWLKDAGITIVATSNVIPYLPSSSALNSPALPSKVTEEEWVHLKTLIETCWHLSQGGTLQIAEPTLWAYLPKIVAIAGQRSEYQTIAAQLVMQGYLLAAVLASHRDDLDARQFFCEQALSYTPIAKDVNLQVAALKQLALTFDGDYKNRPKKALQTYEQAIPLLHKASPLLRSRMYAGLAGTYAQVEQKQEAIRYLSLAYENFPEEPEADPSYLYADCNYFTLILWDGLTNLDLN